MEIPSQWNRAALEQLGFEGFAPLIGLDWSLVPTGHGIYVVLRSEASAQQALIEEHPFPTKKPYTRAELACRWIPSAEVIYIGKATGVAGLRGRLRPFSRKAVGHSGGRSIWYLADSDTLLVAWLQVEDAEDVEREWIAAFRRGHRKFPFANRRS